MALSLLGVVLWASQMTLANNCQCAVEPVIETSDQGTYVGAIAADTESSAGVWYASNGDITIEVR